MDVNGNTALHFAARNGFKLVAGTLVRGDEWLLCLGGSDGHERCVRISRRIGRAAHGSSAAGAVGPDDPSVARLLAQAGGGTSGGRRLRDRPAPR